MGAFLFRRPSSPLTQSILVIVIVHLLIGIAVHLSWCATADLQILRLYFDYEGAAVILLFAAVEVFLTIAAYREFSSSQALKSAWLYIATAAACHCAGAVLKHLLAVDSRINPIQYTTYASSEQLRSVLGSAGTVLGGPVQMILLGSGLYASLRVYRQLGMLSKLTRLDLALIGGAMLYSAVVIAGIVVTIRRNPSAVTVEQALTWPGDYLLSVLLLEAVFLRRSAAEMGCGYISKVWGAFAAGIFLTSFCSLVNWLTALGLFDWTHTAFVWYLWYPAAAAFALGPAYQCEAMRTAQARLTQHVDELELSTA